MDNPIEAPGWILLNQADEIVREGREVYSFRGEVATVIGGKPPHKPESTGKIITSLGTYYPSVFGCRWVKTAD